MSWKTSAKRRVAAKAVEEVKSDMVLGLGSGSTATEFIRALAEKLADDELTDLKGVPTSYQAAQEAVKAKIPLTTLDEYPELDLGFDGADQLDYNLDAIKGGGAALLREKIVASCCKRYLLVADESKMTKVLGTRHPLHLEVHPMALTPVIKKLEKMGAEPVLRQATGKLGPVITENGNNIIDADFGPIEDPLALDERLHKIQGLIETGLFLGYAQVAYVGTSETVLTLKR
jgi:ribose 5-phosphate isomerase A